MSNKINYQKLMEDLIKENCVDNNCTPRLLLHSCCGPCSTYCIQTLSEYFKVTVFYYNPNIYPPEEYHMRAQEQKRFIDEFSGETFTLWRVCTTPSAFTIWHAAWRLCLRAGRGALSATGCVLREMGSMQGSMALIFLTTTFSISPLKNAEKLNEIGKDLESQYGVRYLFSDFKKKEGYKKSTEISKQYDMYRQYYCGCVFSKEQRDREIAARG